MMSKFKVTFASLMAVLTIQAIPAVAQVQTLGEAMQTESAGAAYQSPMLQGSASTDQTPNMYQNSPGGFTSSMPQQDGKFTGLNPPLGSEYLPSANTQNGMNAPAMNGQIMNGLQNGMVAQNNMNQCGAAAQCNMGSQNCGAMNNQMAPNCCQQAAASACCNQQMQSGSCGQMSACPNNMGYAQTSYNNNTNTGNSQFASRAIGIAGTMMMLQMFNNNGGIGGMLRNVGWGDMKFHGRGPSIGAY